MSPLTSSIAIGGFMLSGREQFVEEAE